VAETAEIGFRCDVETREEDGVKVTTVQCHGHLTNQTSDQLKTVVKPIIPEGGKILIDLTDLRFTDSMGLGTLVGLKASAINQGYVTLTLVNVGPRIQELFKITNLVQFLSS
jgi:anti-anti-sigma factor